MSLHDLILDGLQIFQGNQTGNDSIQQIIRNTMINSGISPNQKWYPLYDMVETENTISIYVSIPGVEKKDVEIEFNANNVIVKGCRKAPTEGKVKVREITKGIFERKINLPVSVTKKSNVSLSIENGILLLVINKKEEEKNKFKISFSEEESSSDMIQEWPDMSNSSSF